MKYLKVGIITNTHGVRGGLKVKSLADEPERFLQLEWVYVHEEKKKMTVQKAVVRPKDILLHIEGINDMNQAEALKGCYLYTDESQRGNLEKDRYYVADLLGLPVYDTQSRLIGKLEKVLPAGANDIYVVQSVDKSKEYMIPAVKAFVHTISLDKGYIIIDPIEGMIT